MEAVTFLLPPDVKSIDLYVNGMKCTIVPVSSIEDAAAELETAATTSATLDPLVVRCFGTMKCLLLHDDVLGSMFTWECGRAFGQVQRVGEIGKQT